MRSFSHRDLPDPAPAPGRFNPPVVLTPEAFHVAIGGALGKNSIYELLHVGRLRHVRIGSRFLILASEVTAFFEREALGVALPMEASA